MSARCNIVTFRIVSSLSFISWLETLLSAEVYSPDRIFADHRFQSEDG